MNEILEEQYDIIVETLSTYHNYSTRILKRIVLRAPGKKYLLNIPIDVAISFFLKRFYNWHHITDEMKQLIDQTLSDEERSNPFSDIILSNYPNEALAEKIEHDLTNVSFVQIARLHKLKDEPLQWFNLKFLITGILAVGFFFLRLVPDSIFQVLEPEEPNPTLQRLGGIAGLYEFLVFLYTVLAILFIAVMWSLNYSRITKLKAEKRFIRYALEYFALRAEIHAAQPNASSDVSFPSPSGPDPTSN
jgi:hypothetical protein